MIITPDKILLMLSMLACSLGHVNHQDQHVEVLQATSQEFIAGVPGGGGGITYRLTLKVNTKRPVQFEAIWVAGKKLGVRVGETRQNGDLKSVSDHIVHLLASDYKGGPDPDGRRAAQQAAADPVKAPVAFQGAALLEYMVDGAAKYVAIPTITVLPPIYAQ